MENNIAKDFFGLKVGDLVVPSADNNFLNSYILGSKDIKGNKNIALTAQYTGIIEKIEKEENRVCVKFNFGTSKKPNHIEVWLLPHQIKNLTQ